jgi:hypothetical protein
MRIPTTFIFIVSFGIAATTANAQTPAAKKDVVISKTVLKSLSANKPKSKKQLGEKAGIVRRTSTLAVNAAESAPTSVHQIKPKSR